MSRDRRPRAAGEEEEHIMVRYLSATLSNLRFRLVLIFLPLVRAVRFCLNKRSQRRRDLGTRQLPKELELVDQVMRKAARVDEHREAAALERLRQALLADQALQRSTATTAEAAHTENVKSIRVQKTNLKKDKSVARTVTELSPTRHILGSGFVTLGFVAVLAISGWWTGLIGTDWAGYLGFGLTMASWGVLSLVRYLRVLGLLEVIPRLHAIGVLIATRRQTGVPDEDHHSSPTRK